MNGVNGGKVKALQGGSGALIFKIRRINLMSANAFPSHLRLRDPRFPLPWLKLTTRTTVQVAILYEFTCSWGRGLWIDS